MDTCHFQGHRKAKWKQLCPYTRACVCLHATAFFFSECVLHWSGKLAHKFLQHICACVYMCLCVCVTVCVCPCERVSMSVRAHVCIPVCVIVFVFKRHGSINLEILPANGVFVGSAIDAFFVVFFWGGGGLSCFGLVFVWFLFFSVFVFFFFLHLPSEWINISIQLYYYESVWILLYIWAVQCQHRIVNESLKKSLPMPFYVHVSMQTWFRFKSQVIAIYFSNEKEVHVFGGGWEETNAKRKCKFYWRKYELWNSKR